MFRIVACWWMLLVASVVVAQETTGAQQPPKAVFIAVNEDILPDYRKFVNNRPLESIDYYGGPGSRRDVIELVLLQQALILGGFKTPWAISSEQSYLRTLRNIADGKALTSGGTAWNSDIQPLEHELWTSSPTIKEGEFQVGIYGLASNPKLKHIRRQIDITKLSAVTSTQWRADNSALQNLGVERIIYSNTWFNMLRMLEAKRADFTLAPFQPGANMAIILDGEPIVPAPGVKVVLPGSRHWPVSKVHPLGLQFYQALERGIAQLEAKGKIRKAYTECGFYSPQTKDWLVLP